MICIEPGLEFSMFDDVVSPHPVEDELGFVGHADDVVLHGVGQQSTLVNLEK